MKFNNNNNNRNNNNLNNFPQNKHQLSNKKNLLIVKNLDILIIYQFIIIVDYQKRIALIFITPIMIHLNFNKKNKRIVIRNIYKI